MNWQGLEVKHETYGVGRIQHVEGDYLTVRFETVGDKIFQFPHALGQYLQLEDLEARAEAHRLTEEVEAAIAEREARDEELRSRIEIDLDAELLRRYEKQQRARKRKSHSSTGSRNRSNALFKCELYDPATEATEDEDRTNGLTFADFELGQEVATKPELAESEALQTWTVNAGRFRSGQKAGQGIRMAKARTNSLAILTVVPEGGSEEDRVITSVFLVDRCYEGDKETPAWLKNTSGDFRLKFTPDEARDLKLWVYYCNQTNPERINLGSGAFRYIDDVQSAQILRAIAELLKGTEHEELAQRFFDYYCQVNDLSASQLPKDEGPLSPHFGKKDDDEDEDDEPTGNLNLDDDDDDDLDEGAEESKLDEAEQPASADEDDYEEAIEEAFEEESSEDDDEE